jgi:glycosyltransferase involved in cell wall biosynthesis
VTRRGLVLVHPGNAPFVQHAARALHEAGLLAAYATTFAYDPDSALGRALRLALRPLLADPARELGRRRIGEVPPELVRATPAPELLRMLAVKLRLSPIWQDRVWERTERWFSARAARGLAGAAGVYSYEHVALEPFIAARARGGVCVYDQPIAHYRTVRAILDEEYALVPEARTPYDAHLEATAARRHARMDEELALADLVVAASSFTRDSLVRAGVPAARVALAPYGAPAPDPAPAPRPGGPAIFLSAGSQSARKGTHYLLEAWRRLRPGAGVELWLVGHMALPGRLLRDLPGTVVVRPSVPRTELDELYRRATALVFPSLAEGFGQVITEAMARGLPAITTPHTAGPDLIAHGQDGLIVPIRDPDALAAAMQWCLDNPAERAAMGERALRTAARHQWAHYRARLGAVVAAALGAAEPPAG